MSSPELVFPRKIWLCRALVSVLLVFSVLCIAWLIGLWELGAKHLATKALDERDLERARVWAERAVRWSGQDFEAEFLLARVLRKQLLYEQSLQHLKRAEMLGLDRDRVHREGLLALAQAGEIEGVLDELPKLLMDQQGDGREICEAFANGLLTNGLEDQARLLIAQWSSDYPHDPLPDCLLGRLAEYRVLPKESERHYRAALQKNPLHLPSVFGLARVLCERQQWQEAFDYYRVGLTSPIKAPAQYGMARCLLNQGNEEEALKLLRIAAKTPEADYTAEAKRLGIPTEHDLLATELGTLEAKLGNHQAALPWLKRAVQHNPKHREARYQLAQSLNAMGRSEEAKEHFQWLASTEEKLRELDQLHDVVQANPDDLDARCRLGVLEFEVHSKSAGLFWLRGVLARDPDHAAAKAALARFAPQSSDEP
jgi:tetratricopeptide (TPR) repeat protein